jgi:transcriptional regulator with XRE-family HTH domain
MELRIARGITQTQLAELIGSVQRNISHYETVAELAPSAIIIKIAKALQVSTDYLLGLKPPKPAPKIKEDPRCVGYGGSSSRFRGCQRRIAAPPSASSIHSSPPRRPHDGATCINASGLSTIVS